MATFVIELELKAMVEGGLVSHFRFKVGGWVGRHG
jgi:hypothetical protein